jgi:hypothetical protein
MRNMMLLILQHYVLGDAEVLVRPCIYELMTAQHVHWKLNWIYSPGIHGYMGCHMVMCHFHQMENLSGITHSNFINRAGQGPYLAFKCMPANGIAQSTFPFW